MSSTDVSDIIGIFEKKFDEMKTENKEIMTSMRLENDKQRFENDKQMLGYKKAINVMLVIVSIFIFGSGGFFYNGINTTNKVGEATAKIGMIEKNLIAAGIIKVNEK